MGELGEALRLIHGAHESFQTVRATIRDRRDYALARRALERFARSPEGRRTGFDQIVADEGRDEAGSREEITRVWFERPDRRRTETQGPSAGADQTVRVGELWWIFDSEVGVMSNEEDPSVGLGGGERLDVLLDPAGLIAALVFEHGGHSTVAGRAAIVLHGTRRSGIDYEPALMQLGEGADEYRIAVDAERGILLRVASLLDGQEFAVKEILEVAFDEAFPADTFVLTPPPGEAARGVREPETRDVTIEEAAGLAGFSVWFPARIPRDWRVDVTYVPGDEEIHQLETLLVRLSRADALHSVSILEQPSGEPDPEDPHDDPFQEWVDRQWEGESVQVLTRSHGPNSVRIEREGTRITLTSDLEVDSLLDLARGFVKVPSS